MYFFCLFACFCRKYKAITGIRGEKFLILTAGTIVSHKAKIVCHGKHVISSKKKGRINIC